MAVACGTHSVHDGFSDVIFLFLPLWQAEFALTLTQVGIVKSCYTGLMALGQIPAGLMAERYGERILLAVGTGITGLGFLALSFSDGFFSLLLLLALAGLGSATQHPLSSAIVSRAFDGHRLRTALGIYNFSGDIGKAAVPLLAALVIGAFGWRWATGGYGAVGLVAALAIMVCLAALGAGGAPPSAKARDRTDRTGGWGIRHRAGFATLSAISVIDGVGRTAFLTFLPFLLIAKGADVATVGLSLALTFIGGAAGKFLCGVLAERLGIIRTTVLTEAMTAAGILAILALPLVPTMAVLPLIGAALNGTSSVLYGTVAEFVAPERRSRGFGLFYTLGIGGSARAPSASGLVSDAVGVSAMLAGLAAFILLTIPLALALRRPLRRVAHVA